VKRHRKQKGLDHFDKAKLTDLDRALLSDFDRRRAAYDQALEASNIIYHRHTCPACGFPTLKERHDYEVCMICLWQDGSDERAPTLIAPPNYIAMMQHRIDVAGMLRAFEQTHLYDDSLAAVIAGIRAFDARLDRGTARVDRVDFAANLRNILPTTPRSQG
jgi:hypothetical protein